MENAPVDEIIPKAIFRNISFPFPLDTGLRAAQYGSVRWEPPVAAKSDRAAIGDVSEARPPPDRVREGEENERRRQDFDVSKLAIDSRACLPLS
jgi:hypothetical protein